MSPNTSALYPKNASAKLDLELFQNPSAEYRGTPFWSWNTKLKTERLFEQIEAMRQMGMGGFHMHARVGLDTAYLSDEFMQRVRECVLKAQELKMLAWLYDEDRWPSGAAGGLVTKDHSMRQRRMIWSTQEKPELTRLASFEVVLKDGHLQSYRKVSAGQNASAGTTWHLYEQVAGDTPWHNNQAYVDVLSPRAMKKFVEVTHERYKQAIGSYFGSIIPAIFTDEPQFSYKQQLNYASDTNDVALPYTPDLFDTYAKTYGEKLEEHLPELYWELPDGKVSVTRYRYHDHVAERFAEAFADTIGNWCSANKIAFTGHLMAEESLASQNGHLGEAMRHYRGYQIPGIDILCDHHEYTTAKQAQSAAHQFGRPGVLSELYGVTNWDFNFVGHKAQGDWQAALGVTVRVHHLAWLSMAGESKRDYPAAIDEHSPWYKEYPLVENHFARVNVALTRGKPAIRVGVIHPIESYWISFGPLEHTKLAREELEAAFQNVTKWLLFGQCDFNYIGESLLPQLCPQQTGKKLIAGEMAYDVVIVPALHSIRSTTLDRLERMADAGGTVIFAGRIPSLVDAVPSDRPAKLAARCTRTNFSRGEILEAFENVREVDIRLADGGRADNFIYQMRLDGEDRQLFIVNIDRVYPRDNCRIRIRGEWTATQLDTFTGRSERLCCYHDAGWTVIPHHFTAHGHVLLTLSPTAQTVDVPITLPLVKLQETARLAGPVPVTLSEPNVLLLDIGEWRVDPKAAWEPAEELLRIDTKARVKLGIPVREGRMAQPWTDTQPDPQLASVQLRFVLDSNADIAGAKLALEQPEQASILLDGKEVACRPDGYWVDAAIQTVPLPTISAGKHELLISCGFSRRRGIEWMYLLGDFGVHLAGRYARLTQPVRELAFGDYTRQGLPFYAGNVTYHCKIVGDARPASVEVPHFKAPLLSVDLDGKSAGKIAFAPFRLDLGKLSPGEHRLDITAFGNRMNAFGALHNADERLTWYGPQAYRTTDVNWTYEHQLRRMGILVGPMIKSPA